MGRKNHYGSKSLRGTQVAATFYTLVGLHALHVTVGLTIIALVLALTLRGHVDARHAERTEITLVTEAAELVVTELVIVEKAQPDEHEFRFEEEPKDRDPA